MAQTKLRKRCGAKKRDGSPCMTWAMPNGRCRQHGGTNKGTKGNAGGFVHGLYATGYLPEEMECLPHIPIGNLDQEIQVLKLQLRRAVTAQQQWLLAEGEEGRLSLFELDLFEQSTSVPFGSQLGEEGHPEDADADSDNNDNKIVVHQKKVRKKKDYLSDILKIATTIAKLEATRAEIRLKLPPDNFNYNELGKQIAKELEDRDLA